MSEQKTGWVFHSSLMPPFLRQKLEESGNHVMKGALEFRLVELWTDWSWDEMS